MRGRCPAGSARIAERRLGVDGGSAGTLSVLVSGAGAGKAMGCG
jgi:hypothetical protein